MERKRAFNILTAGRAAGPYDEYPALPPNIDPQLHLSRNDRPQPFHLICELDTVLVQITGRAAVEFNESSVKRFPLVAGDFVYVPAGAPHRIVPETESIQARFKARDAGWEGVAWYCEICRAELWREEWNTAEELPQEGYWRSCADFNANPERRTCPNCATIAPAADLTGIRWREIAAELRAGERGDG
ncbi:MAG: hypothetical protein ACREP6_10490 [Candidatus Binataceae bacterium]